MARFLFIAMIALVFTGCGDARSPSSARMPVPKFSAFPGFATEAQRDVVVHSITALRAAPEYGTYLTISDRIHDDAWLQLIYSEDRRLILDVVSLTRGKPDAPHLAVYDFIEGPVAIENGVETTLLANEQVRELHLLLRERQLTPMVVHLGAKAEDGSWEGYHCSQQAVLDSLSDEQLANLVLEIFRRVHRLEKLSGVGVAINNNRP